MALHFGVTKATVSHHRALLHRLPPEFVNWLEASDDSLILAFFSARRLRAVTLAEGHEKHTQLICLARQLLEEGGVDSSAVTGMIELLQGNDLAAIRERDHRLIELD